MTPEMQNNLIEAVENLTSLNAPIDLLEALTHQSINSTISCGIRKKRLENLALFLKQLTQITSEP